VPVGADDEAAQRRSRLNGVKLRVLIRDHLADDEVPEAEHFAPGAALGHDDRAWVFLDDRPPQRLGAALAWATRSGAESLDIIAESGTGVLARRAAEFSFPIAVWHADGRALLPAAAEPFAESAPAPSAHEVFRERIVEGGAEPVVEYGVLAGEVFGLEVCRVVDDPHTGAIRLEVGVGEHDREAFQMLHGDEPTAEALARIVAVVAQQRQPSSPQHPLNRLAAERLIRWRLTRMPELAGARVLDPAPPPIPRANLKDPVPCVAVGEEADGRPVVAVCVSGVDLDVIPYAADARRAASAARSGVDGGLRLVVAMPSRDRLPVIDQLADLLREPVEFVSVD